MSKANFVEQVLEKSDGNFLYARCVLSSIEHGEFSELGAHELPLGLLGFYEIQWRRMQERVGVRFDNIDRQLILWFSRQRVPMSVIELATTTKIQVEQIGQVVDEWRMFLRKAGSPARFSIYHQSFSDFLTEKIAPGCENNDLDVLVNLRNLDP